MKLIKSIILVIIAYYLLKWLMYPAIIMMIILSFFKNKVGGGLLSISYYLMDVAVSIDQLGNVVCSDLLDYTLIKRNSSRHKFGNPDETISSVIGKNKVDGTLSFIGKGLDKILNLFDNNHSINSIEKRK